MLVNEGTNVSCICSTIPFDWGLYVAVSTLSIPCMWQYFSNILEINCDPLSVTKTLGYPFLLNMVFKEFFTVCVVAFFNGMASGHLLPTSMYVSKNSYPPLAFGKGPTISTHTLSKSWVELVRVYAWLLFDTAHSSDNAKLYLSTWWAYRSLSVCVGPPYSWTRVQTLH